MYPNPTFVGGGYDFGCIQSPFQFDRGSLIHLDNNSKFYTMKRSREYEKLEEEYTSTLALGLSGDLSRIIQEFYQKHPYVLHTLYDVCMLWLHEK